MEGNAELRKNILVLSVIVVITGVFYLLYAGSRSTNIQGPSSGGAPDIRGLLNEWETRGASIYALVENHNGKFKKYTLAFDDKSRVYFAEQGEASRSLEPAVVTNVSGGQFVEIYLRKPAPKEGPKTVDTVVYWK